MPFFQADEDPVHGHSQSAHKPMAPSPYGQTCDAKYVLPNLPVT